MSEESKDTEAIPNSGVGFVAEWVRRPDAQLALADLLGHYVPATVVRRIPPEVLDFRLSEDSLSPLQIPASRERSFVEAYLALLSEEQGAELAAGKAA